MGGVARDGLKKLKHTTSVWEYAKQFSSLMLDIKDMLEADKLYSFIRAYACGHN